MGWTGFNNSCSLGKGAPRKPKRIVAVVRMETEKRGRKEGLKEKEYPTFPGGKES